MGVFIHTRINAKWISILVNSYGNDGFFFFLIWTLAKKTPLFISLPLAVIAWSLFAWFVWKHG